MARRSRNRTDNAERLLSRYQVIVGLLLLVAITAAGIIFGPLVFLQTAAGAVIAFYSLFIGFKKNPRRHSQSSWFYEFGRHGRFVLRVNELHMRYEGARRGIGVTLLPCHLADQETELVRVAPPPRDLLEDVYLLMHATGREVPRVRRVGEALIKLFAVHAEELMGAHPRNARHGWKL